MQSISSNQADSFEIQYMQTINEYLGKALLNLNELRKHYPSEDDNLLMDQLLNLKAAMVKRTDKSLSYIVVKNEKPR